MSYARQIFVLLIAASYLTGSIPLHAQVTTATVYGVVQDPTGAVLPGATVVATNQGTNLSREGVTDERGEFAIPALPAGTYTLKIELAGFKTYLNQGLQLGAGQTVRQTFSLAIGQLSENITVAESAPLVETATAAQQESIGRQEVTELPLARRNLIGLMTLTPGATENSTGIAGGGNIRLNGVAEGGTAITVDGTDAVSNSETRGTGTYGGQNQISVMSIEAVAEVQVIKGILPAEYGGAAGGQVNMLSRSGTNTFHGSAFENYQSQAFSARDPFLPGTAVKPKVRFNQFGGSIGGPIVRNRVMFFAAYEGYRETAGMSVQGNVPTQQTRDRILAALPMPETKIALDQLPLPNEPISADLGRYRASGDRERRDNHLTSKGDVLVWNGNMSVTYTRMRPYTKMPSIYVANNQKFFNTQDRIATQYVLARGSWVSESRFGWNRSFLDRFQDFWFVSDPTKPVETEKTKVGRRVPLFTISGLFGTVSSEILELKGRSFSAEQKLSRIVGAHNVKVGVRWARQGGSKTNPQNPNITFQNLSDFLANIPNSVGLQNGKPPHDGHLDEFGGFIQDDWRVNKKLVLNLGLRYDSYSTISIAPTTSTPAEIVNLEPPTDLRKMDFGAFRDPKKPYDPDRFNFGPRVGFVWSLSEKSETVIRGGVGVLFSPHLFAAIQNSVSDPFGPADVTYNRTEVAARGLKWPAYGEDIRNIFVRESAGKKFIYALMDPKLSNPYTVQSLISFERAIGSSLMAEVDYVRTDGQNFPLNRPLVNAFDRQTGARPNPALGTPGGYYLSSDQTMVYNALQTSLRRRFSNNLGFDIHYTLRKGWSDQGGGLSSAFVNGDIFYTQDFWDPKFDRGPLSQEARHNVAGNVIYELPWLRQGRGVLSQVLGGWQIASIVSMRTGVPLRITQPSGISQSRPDYVGGDTALSNWADTLLYLNRAAFALVPTYPVTNATVRSGTANPSLLHGPGRWQADISLAKSFQLRESVRLQLRADAFNALNHVNYGAPTTSIASPDFGRITSAPGWRTGQVGARLSF
ncbi:MAG TPA: TonB-dependent receptor [Terriglobia bacterium]|nr:TonB-dependent receptor [Terriglobia bacterium]